MQHGTGNQAGGRALGFMGFLHHVIIPDVLKSGYGNYQPGHFPYIPAGSPYIDNDVLSFPFPVNPVHETAEPGMDRGI
jgi:hypothetical protein